ncbi:MAG: 50S ribosomal protein L4 [Halobacteriovoraceae bacterium]|nr:50S ribosomal protein L4 [Halobacteriovoraceae bacterium]
MSTKVKLYNENFEPAGDETVSVDLSTEVISVPAVHQVVKSLLANRRQGTASTKTKGLVSGGGAKPFKQKGTGRARQGSIRAPNQVGGGTAFGPQPRDFSQKINKKMMKKAIRSVLADKNNEGALFVVNDFKSDGKTKTLSEKLTKKDMLPALFISEDRANAILKASNNLERGKGLPVEGFSVYEAVKFKNLIIEKGAFDKLVQRLV